MRIQTRRLALFAAGALATFGAGTAAAFPVVDIPHTALTSANVAASAAKWGKELQHIGSEVAHWHSQIQYMQSQLFALQSMSLMPQVLMQDQFRKRPESYGMVTTCASNEAPSLDKLWRSFVPSMEGSLARQQQELCQRIVLAENAKYNATVDLLLQLRDRDLELEAITRQRLTVAAGQQGNLAANENQINMFATNLQMDLQRWQSTIMGYNNHIESLKSEQRGLARRAFDGQPSPLGTSVGTKALKSALGAFL